MKPLGFEYTKTAYNYVQYHKDGKWEKGVLKQDDQLVIPSMATVLHYGQEAFEGLKAHRRKDGQVQIFRPYENAKRFQCSCEFLLMPRIEVEDFVEAVLMTVKANLDFVPAYGTSSSLYIRPYMIGVGENLGLKPSSSYLFGIIVTPVGPYFSRGFNPVNLLVSEYDRVAPNGTGKCKIGGNYAASMFAQRIAKQQGFDDCLFLDPSTHTKIEEVGAANFFGISGEDTYISPVSPSILNSITNMSLRYIAKEMLNMKVIQDDIYIDQLDHLSEAAACGTAAVITPIRSLTHQGKTHIFDSGDEAGKVTKKLYELLTGIQSGDIEDPDNWNILVK